MINDIKSFGEVKENTDGMRVIIISIAFTTLSMNASKACVVLCFLWKPNCELRRAFGTFRKLITRIYIIFSRILEKIFNFLFQKIADLLRGALFNGAIKYVSSFICIIMSAISLKILVEIDNRNQVIQARKATVDVEVSNLNSLLSDLKFRNKWPDILTQSKLVASAMNVPAEFSKKRKAKKSVF